MLVFLFLATVLIAPVVLNRVIQVVAHRVHQPVAVEQECQRSANHGSKPVQDALVETVSDEHQTDLHEQREYRCDGSKRDFNIDLTVMRKHSFGIIKDKHER